MELGPGPPS